VDNPEVMALRKGLAALDYRYRTILLIHSVNKHVFVNSKHGANGLTEVVKKTLLDIVRYVK
jgi:hypothetical protein